MKYASTRSPNSHVSAERAVLEGLAPDGGLYMPVTIPNLTSSFIDSLHERSLQEIGCEIARVFFANEIPVKTLDGLVNDTLSFNAPLVPIGDSGISTLELFHGPTLAFKDFGARFMARVMSYFHRGATQELTVLVATSGDTGSAVASGFLNVDGIRVVLLYPSGKVSRVQEQQLTTCGGNITALEVSGTFDDCQRLVKEAFLDEELRKCCPLTSANSINISRLIPQSFYYWWACAQCSEKKLPAVVSVPSGNFGNLTAGIFARKMGAPIKRFIAATNANDIVPAYLESGEFTTRPSVETLSNAMDVGNPSNFERMQALFGNKLNEFQNLLDGKRYTDEETVSCIETVYREHGYTLDPHGAVGFLGLKDSLTEEEHRENATFFLETAHPAKFPEAVAQATGEAPELPESLQACLAKPKQSIVTDPTLSSLREILLCPFPAVL